MARRRVLYGTLDLDRGEYRVSKYPPDAPVRPSLEFEHLAEVEQFAKGRRAEMMWFPPLPEKSKCP